MSFTFTRQALYEHVWAEPMQSLSKRFSISDRGLAKICAAANIPVPARGYWAKLQAGQPVKPPQLPERALGQSDRVQIGARAWGERHTEDARILAEPTAPPPVFEPDMEVVRQQVATMVRKAPLPVRGRPEWHSQIARLLDKDEERERKKRASLYPEFTEGAVLGSVFETRRLRILNALFTCLARCGMYPSISGKYGRDVSVTVGGIAVPLMLDGLGAVKQIERERYGYAFMARGDRDRMRLTISHSWPTEANCPAWQDEPGSPLERILREIATAIIVLAEQRVRDGAFFAHTSGIKRKAELEEESRKRQAEEERRQRDLQAKREQARVDHLIAQARALERAERIRSYVGRVEQLNATSPNPMTVDELSDWATWAIAQADRIDPVVSGLFRTRPAE